MAIVFKLFIGNLLTLMSLLVSADSSKYYIEYDPVGHSSRPYKFGNKEDGRDHTKRPVRMDKDAFQRYLFTITDETEDFKRAFDYFNQFEEGLNINIASYITRDSYLTSALHYKHWNIASYLIGKNIDVNHQNRYGITALMQVAECGHFPIVEELILAKATTLIEDDQKETALIKAIKGRDNNHCPEGDYDAVISLLERAMERENEK